MNRPRLRFGTLGSEGSNHSLIVRRYIEFRRLDGAEVKLFADFDAAFEALVVGTIDFLLQVSVHPSHTDMVARYTNRAHIVDAFIAPSKVLAIVTRQSVATPKTIALQPATRCYADLSRWERQIPEASIMTVAEGLLADKYDSGLTSLEIAEKHPDKLRVDHVIGSISDVWVLFGRTPIPKDPITAWPDAPVTALFATA